MGYSIKLKIDREYPRKDGTCHVFFQIIINRQKLRLGLDIYWPAARFDENMGCKSRKRNDEDATTNNIIINNARTKASQIFKDYQIRDQRLDVDQFKKEYYSTLDKRNFVEYLRTKSNERWAKGLIEDNTYRTEKTTANRLQEYSDKILFSDFNSQWAHEFDQWLRKFNDVNTRWAHHKKIKTYLAIARDVDQIKFQDPYLTFKVKQVRGKWKALSKSQLGEFVKFYVSDRCAFDEKIILRKFLFGCFTGLRISDIKRLTIHNFKNGKITLRPEKTTNHGIEIVDVPLNDMALVLLRDELPHQRAGSLFWKYTEANCNRRLKDIARKIKVDHHVHFHVGRSTFASLYDQAGGNHRSLMEVMGLAKIETLAKYVQTNADVISESIEKMNSSFSDFKKD